MQIGPQCEGAPGLDFEIWDIDTIRTLRSVRVADTSMTVSLACLLSEASANTSISTGKERDPESGLDYFGARYYGSTMGRFTVRFRLTPPFFFPKNVVNCFHE
jgi:hypothetical protein